MNAIVGLSEAEPLRNMPRDTSEVELGQWYWVEGQAGPAGEKYEWLGCVMHVGSNYLEINEPRHDRVGNHTARIHFNDYWTKLRFEPNPEAVINGKVAYYQAETRRLMGEVQAIARRLGVAPTAAIADQSGPGSNALAVMSSAPDVKAYSRELALAKETTLPDLFKDIESANGRLAQWLGAATMPMLAQIKPLKGIIGAIEDSIFNVSLYAGLTEDAVAVREGEPAGLLDRLHVQQRRLYMDEECLLTYEGGGMDINGIEAFDAWMAKPENFKRLLPHPRTIAAFRVRRLEKERAAAGSVPEAFVRLRMREADKWTFLYVRNGEQVWRIGADFDYGPKLFPDAGAVGGDEPMMMDTHWHKVEAFITAREFEDRKAAHDRLWAEYERKRDEWYAANADVKNKSFHCPHREPFTGINPRHWEPFNADSVYYDEGRAMIEGAVKAYNRVGLIIQGLFDRSPVLHPHLPVKTWTAEGFEQALTLVYDSSGSALYEGEKPDFEAYRERLNRTIGLGSVVVGQQDIWLRREAERYNERVQRVRDASFRTHYQPYGDPGPGLCATVEHWRPRSRQVTFRWGAATEMWRADSPTKPRSIRIPTSSLLNITAYQPGDFKQFYRDPRTRAEYLKWAPLMLAAEDYYHACRAAAEEAA